jgi:hypothetical protein
MLVFTEKNKGRYFMGKPHTLSADEHHFLGGFDFEDINNLYLTLKITL